MGGLLKFTGKDISPNINESERKINIESLFNTIFRINNIQGYKHCIYDSVNKDIHVYVEK